MDDKNYYFHYYNSLDVLYRMQRYTYKREFALIPPKGSSGQTTRNLKANSVQHIKYILQNMHISEKPYNLYTSVAVYKDGIPNQTMNLKKRNNDEWNKSHWRHIERYDFLIDVDGNEDDDLLMGNIFNLCQFLNETECPYYLRWSGNGFHILIPEWAFPKRLSYEPRIKNNIYQKYHEIAVFLMDNISQLIDTSIYDSRRLIKIPYSIALPSMTMCCPIENIGLFRSDHYHLSNKSDLLLINESLFNSSGTASMLLNKAKVRWE